MKIAIVAGEASGDALGADLIKALREIRNDLIFFGIGGPAMRAEGFQAWYPQEWLAVRGYVEVLQHLPRLMRVRASLIRRLKRERPHLFIGIDAPDFNLGVEAKLKAAGIRTVHYVSPTIWAWRRQRISLIKRAADRVLTLFPFEAALYRDARMAATYVGHPLADRAPLEHDLHQERARFKLSPHQPVVALLPGSRISELELHSELFVETAQIIHQQLPDSHFLIPLVNRETRHTFEQALYRLNARSIPHTLLYAHADWALKAADVALIASGTATLEAALYKCPHVVTYRLRPFTYWLVRRKLRIPYAALPNILLERFVVPELLQDAATAPNLAQAVLNLYLDITVRERLRKIFADLHAKLRCGSAARAAQAVTEELQVC